MFLICSQTLMTGPKIKIKYKRKGLTKKLPVLLGVPSYGFATKYNIRRKVIFISKVVNRIPNPEIELLPKILPFPYCRPHVPHTLVVQGDQYGGPRIWIHLQEYTKDVMKRILQLNRIINNNEKK